MKRLVILCSLFLGLLCTSCQEKGITEWTNPEEQLKTARIGVVLGWSQDFIFEKEGRPCARYQDVPEAIMALANGDIDAFYFGYDLALDAVEKYKEFKILDYGKKADDVSALCRIGDTELIAQWKEFAKKVRERPEWQKIQEAYFTTQANPEGLMLVDPPTEGKLLRIGYEDEGYPITYYLPGGNVIGYSVTILNMFAREYGYRLEYASGTWDSNIQALKNNKIDCIIDFFSPSFKDLMESTGDFILTDPYLSYYMVYLVRSKNNDK